VDPDARVRRAHAVVHLEPAPAAVVDGELRSREVAHAPFDRLLVSWNADVAPGAGFEVEVRVRADDGPESPWSAWLFVGEWGDLPGGGLGARRVEHGGARIATDELVGARAFRAAEVRVLARGAVTVRRLSLCFSSPAAPAEPAEPAAPAAPGLGGAATLDVPRFSQLEEGGELGPRVCSPTSLAMVLAYHGVRRDVLEVARLAYDDEHDIYGNWPRSIQTAWELGVPGYAARLRSLDEVASHLRAGRPIVLSLAWKPGGLDGAPIAGTDGHLLVVVGLTPDTAVVHDPAAPTAETVRRAYDRVQLERAWLSHGAVAYVLGH
jgi:hypothetical protein